jgi:hypothetical protein
MDTLIETTDLVPDAPTVELLQHPFGMIQQGIVFLTDPREIINSWMTQEKKVVQVLSQELLQNPKQLSQKLDLIGQWVDHTVLQIRELNNVMLQLEAGTQTTSFVGPMPLHIGPNQMEWTFMLFRVEERTIQDMTWPAFLKQVELHKILDVFYQNMEPIIAPDPSTRGRDITECRDKWGVLKDKLTEIWRVSQTWSSTHGCKDIHYLVFEKLPSECHIFMLDEDQITNWIEAEQEEDEEEKAVVKALVDTQAVNFFERYWGKKHRKFGSTYFKAVHSPQYAKFWEEVTNAMYEELIQRSVTRNCIWGGLGTGLTSERE